MVVTEKFSERREQQRMPLMVPVEILFGDATLDAVIFDISLDGAKVRMTDAGLHPENDITKPIALNVSEAGRVDGEVIWIDDEYVGIEFDDGQKTMLNLVLQATSGPDAV